MKQAREKIKLTFDLKTFLVIVTTIGSITFWGSNIVNKIDTIAITQTKQQATIESLIAKRDADHKIIDTTLAYLSPTVERILDKIGL